MAGEIEGIDPKQLIVQEGPNKGNIAEKELARVGAQAEQDVRENVKGAQPVYIESVGDSALLDEVGRRAEEITPEMATSELKDKIRDEAVHKFKFEKTMKKTSPRDREVLEEDERKAKDLLDKIEKL